ncbi:hypothetical protein CAPTEDRAFT_195252 [Capitella teleta]|uniref:G-protein coupled receptors family 1 profile domain-containing protein n=1 Tax=Capitella teleta TaxID=283909 RepID=R7TXZ0_CAPTE|nr:hypothetical protein CAPTEDRAFT_195252 [Capitella teleta]|eukprot:ELT95805.1 hypothetical protein CAPTEDRAFT_195252 [Capitella teleta]
MATTESTTEMEKCPSLPNGQINRTCHEGGIEAPDEEAQLRFMISVFTKVFSNDLGCTLFLITVLGLLSFICIVVGIIGNIFTMATLWARIKKSGTILLMFCLAFSDLGLLLTNGPFALATAFINTQSKLAPKLELTNFGASYMGDISNTLEFINIWLTVMIMWHRYRAINSTHQGANSSYRVAAFQVTALVVAALLFNIPLFLETRKFFVSATGLTQRTSSIVSKAGFILVYKTVFYYIIYYVVPMSALIFFTIRSKQILSYKMAATQITLSETHQHEMTMSLIRVTTISVLCYMMSPVRRILLAVSNSNSTQFCGVGWAKSSLSTPCQKQKSMLWESTFNEEEQVQHQLQKPKIAR